MVRANTVAVVPDPDETPLQKFERELQARYPGRVVQRFEMPSNIKQARAIYLVEITSREEIQAAIYADSAMSPLEKQSVKLTNDAERRECIRVSLVGLVPRTDAVTYRHINHDGVPFHEMDNWPSKATAALNAYFNDVNGIPTVELIEGLKGARTIGGSAPPTNETPQSSDTAK